LLITFFFLSNLCDLSYLVEERVDSTSSATLTVVYDGTGITPPLRSVVHTGLAPYSVHQYRVTAYNGAGSSTSGYAVVRTDEGAPGGIQPLSILVLTGTSAVVTWGAPTAPNGVISLYEVVDANSNATLYSGGFLTATLVLVSCNNVCYSFPF
jgi:hypothetical protein